MVAELNPDTISAIAAFFSGIGTVLTGALALRYERRRSREECAERLRALHEGIEIGREGQGTRLPPP